MNPLSGWENFYVIVGSSAGALIGLQFVVIALIADLPMAPTSAAAGSAFGTPNVVHFSTVLLLAACLTAPWPSIFSVAIACGLIGICGFIYVLHIIRRMRSQTAYRPEAEDWIFHAIIPLLAYGILAGSTLFVTPNKREPLFAIALASLLLLFAAIHNAWDAVTYHVYFQRSKHKQTETATDRVPDN